MQITFQLYNFFSFSQLPQKTFNHLNKLFKQNININLNFLSTYNNLQFIPTPNLNIISTLYNIFKKFIKILNNQKKLSNTNSINTNKKNIKSSKTTSTKSITFTKKSKKKTHTQKLSFLQHNPSQLLNFLKKLYIFTFT